MNELTRDQLPLRKRGTLEIFDVSLKLFKRYFVPIIVWSLVSGLAGLLGMVIPGAGMISFLVTPILLGAVGCSLAAAIHGRDATFKDCWEFAKKRYGAILLVYFVSSLVAFLIAFASMMVIGLVMFVVTYLITSQGFDSSDLTTILGVVGIVVVGLCMSVFFALLFAWIGMTPLALCLEGDGKDNLRFLRRTYDLMRGYWWKIFGLISLVGLAILGLVVIFMGLASMIIGLGVLREVTNGQISPDSLTRLVAGYVGSFSLVSILWAPFYYLALGVQYLDLRVRKEALDLEWAAQDRATELV